ncbi:hypothetical protein C8T65DRAFT_303426 [Cerioporus squamosus]|nr:hypothetical protein C8T65DRAFT_303426 [Cerioporus squamosus]
MYGREHGVASCRRHPLRNTTEDSSGLSRAWSSMAPMARTTLQPTWYKTLLSPIYTRDAWTSPLQQDPPSCVQKTRQCCPQRMRVCRRWRNGGSTLHIRLEWGVGRAAAASLVLILALGSVHVPMWSRLKTTHLLFPIAIGTAAPRCPCISGRCSAARVGRMDAVQDVLARCSSPCQPSCAGSSQSSSYVSYARRRRQHPHAKPRVNLCG